MIAKFHNMPSYRAAPRQGQRGAASLRLPLWGICRNLRAMNDPEFPQAQPTRFAVRSEQIARVVAAFYAGVRRHPELGPIFAGHVKDWAEHEAKITRFWRNAIQLERSYHGNPIQVHRAAGDVHARMFAPWLVLFDQTLAAQLPADLAAAWSALAHRIGRGLRMGLESDKVPRLI
jgi:hemoglobin